MAKKKAPGNYRKLTAFLPDQTSPKKKTTPKAKSPTTSNKLDISPKKQKLESLSEQVDSPEPSSPASMDVFSKATAETESKIKSKQTPIEQITPKEIGEHDTPLVKIPWKTDPQPIGDEMYAQQYPRNNKESQQSWHLRILVESGQIVQNLENGILLNVEYDGALNKAFLKFYDISDDTIKIWIDTTGHRPYLLHKKPASELGNIDALLDHDGYDGLETIEKYDLLADKKISMTKIYGITPTDIGGANGLREVFADIYDDENGGSWESRIRYHHNFIYDRDLIPGMSYRISEGKLTPIPPTSNPELERQLMDVFKNSPQEMQEMAKLYHPIFSATTPFMKRLAYDIEVAETVDGTLPDPIKADKELISISFVGNDGFQRVYCLDRPDQELGFVSKDFPQEAEVFFFTDEKELLKETFRLLWKYPIIITFNGDNFDNTFLYNRARRLKIPSALNPIYTRRGGGMVSRYTEYKQNIHIDIFQFFANRSIKGYAFGGAYLRNSLEEISSSLLGEGKVKHEGVLIGNMTLARLIHYNLMDSILTLDLTQFNNEITWNLMMVLMKITRLPLQDMYRLQISAWIRSLLYGVHKKKNYLIPRMSELELRGDFSRQNQGKFQGAYVITPVPGIHFGVAVLDFSSLYPSIIKTRNLSYETVNCQHPECRDNMLPNTPYWVCTKNMGIFAYVVGFLRDIRVKWFKPLSNNAEIAPKDRQTAKVMASALKVFINGAYGVFGSPVFPMYFRPVAEATTATGRFSIQRTIEKAESMGIHVLYGDSDSVFLDKPTADQVQNLVKWSEEELDLDLELEKTYQFLALSERKKNYIGVYEGGHYVDIKGLMAKKHNTPQFIKDRFELLEKILTEVKDTDSFTKNRSKIIDIIKKTIRLIGKPQDQGGFAIEDYAITVMMTKNLSAYTKTMPQHVRAAKLDTKNTYERGSFVSFVKTRTSDRVKPTGMASLPELDIAKYKEMVQSTFEQVLDALNIDYEEVKGVKKLSSFF